MIRVLLVDDHTPVRQGLRNILEMSSEFNVVGEACNGEEAVQSVPQHAPCVVVMDIHMPRLNGIEATAQITRAYPHVVVVGLSMNTSEEYRLAMMAAGAATLLQKEEAAEKLCAEIQKSVNRRLRTQSGPPTDTLGGDGGARPMRR